VSAVPAPGQSELSPSEIVEVQTRLEALGMKAGAPDGIPGSRTIGAVKRYEEANGRPPTGNIDRELLGRLRQEKPVSQAPAVADGPRQTAQEEAASREAAASKAAEGRPKPDADMRRPAQTAETALNLSEQDRKRVQVALTTLGHDVPATGYFGPITRAMITDWQKKQGLPETGFIDSTQLATLRQQASAQYDQRKP
jgi:peptidoglycan hydrolase-like protein with peptidoglycan-binding domain